jgi:hypothetical protein
MVGTGRVRLVLPTLVAGAGGDVHGAGGGAGGGSVDGDGRRRGGVGVVLEGETWKRDGWNVVDFDAAIAPELRVDYERWRSRQRLAWGSTTLPPLPGDVSRGGADGHRRSCPVS